MLVFTNLLVFGFLYILYIFLRACIFMINKITRSLYILSTNDNTKNVEEAIQKTLFKVKNAIGEEEYQKIYPSGSNPGKFYGTAKIHKVKPEDEDKLEKLPLRPIVSNIGTATHKTAQFLCRLLTPLTKSKYTIQNTKDFVDKVRKMKVPKGYKM